MKIHINYEELESRYGEGVAQYLVREIERAAKVAINDNVVNFEARLTSAQAILDRKASGGDLHV